MRWPSLATRTPVEKTSALDLLVRAQKLPARDRSGELSVS